MNNQCMHCLQEGNWTDEDKCPQCASTGHTSPWEVSSCPACNKQFFDKMDEIMGRCNIHSTISETNDYVEALEVIEGLASLDYNVNNMDLILQIAHATLGKCKNPHQEWKNKIRTIKAQLVKDRVIGA